MTNRTMEGAAAKMRAPEIVYFSATRKLQTVDPASPAHRYQLSAHARSSLAIEQTANSQPHHVESSEPLQLGRPVAPQIQAMTNLLRTACGHMLPWIVLAALPASASDVIPLSDPTALECKSVDAAPITYKGKRALKLVEKAGGAPESETFAFLRKTSFHNGVIELDVAGAPSAGAVAQARGFIGVAFRVQPDASKFEVFYIRPTNGRADDQLRRNHSTQYVSFPAWPWDRLRKESPGVYESYADMVPGEWTHLRIVVHGIDARLYVGDPTPQQQPALIIHDLKLGDSTGSVGLWIGPGTEGYFRNLNISAEGQADPK
jgi:hypothetical protein